MSFSVEVTVPGTMRITGDEVPPFSPPNGSVLYRTDLGKRYSFDQSLGWSEQADTILSVQKVFGAKCDDVADDTAAVQAALDSLGSTATAQRTGPQTSILIPGKCRITNTLTAKRKSFTLEGTGWGLQDGSANAAYLRWDGPAGIPMLKIQDCANTHVRNLRLVGNITNKPSAGLNFNQTGPSGAALTANTVEDVMIGLLSNNEGNNGDQFVDGILLDGYPNNNAEHTFKNIKVNHVSRDGFHVSAVQSVDLSLHGAYFSLCGRSAIYNCGYIVGTNVVFAGCAIDIMHPYLDDQAANSGARTQIQGYFSENAGRMADLDAGHLILNGTSYALSASTNADGKVIRADSNSTSVSVEIRNLYWFQSAAPPTPPYLALSPKTNGTRHIVIDGCAAWSALTGGTNGMDVATTGSTARAYLYLRDYPQTTGTTPVRVAQNFIQGASGLNWNINRFEVKAGVFTTATRPAAADYAGFIIYVSDGAGGSKFQGSDGSSWVSLG